jgi:hypothetical protein
VDSFENVPIMIVGACGSIGRAVTENLIQEMESGTIVLRDTNSMKLEKLQREYKERYPNVKFIYQVTEEGAQFTVDDFTLQDDKESKQYKIGIVMSAVTSDKILLTKEVAKTLSNNGHYLVYIEDSQPDTVEKGGEEHLAIVNVLARVPALNSCNYDFGHVNQKDLFGCLVEAYSYNLFLEKIDELKRNTFPSEVDIRVLGRLETIKSRLNGSYGRGIMGRVEMNTEQGKDRMKAIKEMYAVIGEDQIYKLGLASLQHCGIQIQEEVLKKTGSFLQSLDTPDVST